MNIGAYILIAAALLLLDKYKKRFNVGYQTAPVSVALAIVASLAPRGIWVSMDRADKKPVMVTQQLIITGLVIVIPFILLLYRGYLKDTTPPPMLAVMGRMEL